MYRKNAKISALSSLKLDKYEYLTGEDVGYRPDYAQKAKFEYSPLGQVFNKGLTTNHFGIIIQISQHLDMIMMQI